MRMSYLEFLCRGSAVADADFLTEIDDFSLFWDISLDDFLFTVSGEFPRLHQVCICQLYATIKRELSFQKPIHFLIRHDFCYTFFTMFIFLFDEFHECILAISCHHRLSSRENSRNLIINDGSSVDWSDDLFLDDDPETELARYLESMTEVIMISHIGDDMASTTSETGLHDDRFLYPIKYSFRFFECPSKSPLRHW